MPLDLKKGPYHTEPVKKNFWSKTFPGFFFYGRLLSITYRASRKALKGVYSDQEWTNSSHEALQALEKAGVSIHILGFEHVLSEEKPCVFVGNHMSTLETFLLPGILLPHKRHTYIIKKSLLTYPIFRHVMASRDPIALSRTNPREDLKVTLVEGKQKLDRGLSIIIFPQTTRTTVFDPAQFNSIGIKLAKQADCPVIPVAIKSDAWGNGSGRFKDFGKIDAGKKVFFEFGEPLHVRGNGQKEHEQVISFITERLKTWAESDKEEPVR